MAHVSPRTMRAANRMAMSPYIVQAHDGRLRDVVSEVADFDGFSTIGDIGPAGLLGIGGIGRGFDSAAFLTQKMTIPAFNMVTAMLPRESLPVLARSDSIRAIWPDNAMYALQTPILPDDGVFKMRTKTSDKFLFTSTEHTKRLIGGNIATDAGFTGKGLTVAVIDTGGTRWHPATPHLEFDTVLQGQLVDHQGHGEWCASCIGGYRVEDATLSSAVGKKVMCEGFVPDARLVSIKALGYGIGTGSTSGIIRAIELAVYTYHADGISMSLGGSCGDMESQDDDPFTPVMKKVIADGVIPVIAAGNEGPAATTIGSPGWIEDVLTIGAYDPVTGVMADFSSRGPTRDGRVKPDCTAPGVNIDSAIIGMLDNAGDNKRNRFSPISGTSMATPHAFGLIMQMKQCHHETLGAPLTVGEVKDMLISSGNATKNSDSGWGHIHWGKYEKWLSTMYGVA